MVAGGDTAMRSINSIIGAILVSWLGAGAANAVPLIDVSPGPSPAGYVPLSLFGVAPETFGDDEIQDFSVPVFNYAGESWSDIGVSSNGIVVVGGTVSLADDDFTNQAFPLLSSPNNVLAPFWADLNPAVAGGIRIAVLTDGVSDWIVVDWNGIPLFGDAAALNSFEVWIGVATNPDPEDISFVYDVISSPGGLTVGAEDKTGTVGDMYFFDPPGFPTTTAPPPTQGLELQVTWADLPVQVPEPLSLAILGSGLILMPLLRRRRTVGRVVP
jgi:hypothetical protein